MKRGIWRPVNLRRGIQILFLLVFVMGVVWTQPIPGVEPHPVLKWWFFIDPLICVATSLAAHAVPDAALLALILVVFTFIMGRVFCGWICPLGTIHDLAGRLWDSMFGNPKSREHWSPRQRIKYYLLIGFLVMAVFGGHWVNVCPFKDLPGVRVLSANETRHPDNRPILPAGDLPYGPY